MGYLGRFDKICFWEVGGRKREQLGGEMINKGLPRVDWPA